MNTSNIHYNINYFHTLQHQHRDNCYVAIIKEVHSEEELYDELTEKLAFPSYFGRNWDALDEFYTWFYWIEQHDIYIYHESIGSLPEDVLQMYLNVICYACECWEYRFKDSEHQVHFYFNEKDRQTIAPVVNGYCLKTELGLEIESWLLKMFKDKPIPEDIKTLNFDLSRHGDNWQIRLTGSRTFEWNGGGDIIEIDYEPEGNLLKLTNPLSPTWDSETLQREMPDIFFHCFNTMSYSEIIEDRFLKKYATMSIEAKRCYLLKGMIYNYR